MVVTTQQLLKFLPIDEKVRQDTLAKIGSYTPDQKLMLEKILWSAYYDYLKANIQYEFERALLDVQEGKRSMDKSLYRKIEDQVYQKFMRDLREQQESETITQLRDEFKQMISSKVEVNGKALPGSSSTK
ncbi:hypothetical protein M1271_01685 [Patescibacteria group bacterium]|nr:hypothetical protein [Patescibacteria group bacterium]